MKSAKNSLRRHEFKIHHPISPTQMPRLVKHIIKAGLMLQKKR